MRYVYRLSLAGILVLALSASLHAQQKLTPEDYGQWERLSSSAISSDAGWFAWQISPVDADGWLVLKETSAGTDTTGQHRFMYGSSPEFSGDSRWFAFRIGVSEEQEEKLEEQDEQVKYRMGLVDLSTGESITVPDIQDFEFSETGEFLVMQKYRPEEVKTDGTDLLIRNLETGSTQILGNVSDYAFNEEGTHLAITIDASGKLGNGVQLLNLANSSSRTLDSDTTTYGGLTWSEEGGGLAFYKEQSDKDYEDPTHLVYAFRDVTGSSERQVYDHRSDGDFPEGMRVTDTRSLTWSEDEETLFFGIAEWKRTEKEEADSTDLDADLEPSNVQVWHWKDADIQPRQEITEGADRRFSYLSAWHLSDNRLVRLADEEIENVNLTDDGRYAVGYDPTPYEPPFRESWNDIWLIDVENGERTQILERHENVSGSPGARYLLWFTDNNWHSYDIESGEHINLTEGIDTRFENFLNVTGREQYRPFGSGMWAEDDEWVLLYDRFDVWRVRPDGSGHERLTDGAEDEIVYRQIRLDFEEDFLDPDQPIYLGKYGEYTKNRGYARLDGDDLEELIYEPMQIGRLDKAESADRFVYVAEAADDSPDFFITGSDFSDPVQLTSTNTQQEKYHWADDELITFENARGDTLQGRLLYPADYREGEQYPMIVYIYEERSQTLHNYSTPSRTSAYNQRRYSSEGYFVFEPDINYVLRDPGVSAVESVVPAVEKVLETGMIDEERIGLTGHSWGAYQTSFIITQTDIFNSAVAGAPLTNMVSMYNSIYWNSGSTDAQIFEVSQGRFPDPWWEDWDKFIENSPIFQMEENTTPLLVEFGTEDGAVDFNQGVELYNTMRRMEQPYVMLVYEGENHGLRREENMIDYATRAFQWHEHFLKGVEAPEWIESGLPWLERPEVVEEDR